MSPERTLTAIGTDWLTSLGLGQTLSDVVARVAIVLVIVGLSLLANFIAKKLISTVIRSIVRRTKAGSTTLCSTVES